MANPVITLDGVHKVFTGNKSLTVHAVNGVSIDIYEGEIFGVIGFSGAGKSTLVRLFNGLEKVTEGKLTVLGKAVENYRDRQWQPLRRDISMVFQHFNLFNAKTVTENIAYPLKLDKLDKQKISERVKELLAFVGIEDKANAYPDELSGGQKQRVGIARALARSPKILLADEATSALDPETTHDVIKLLKRVNQELGITIIIITHAMDVVKYTCDRVAVMEDGYVIELGDVYSIFSNPQHEVTKRFIGSTLRDKPAEEVLESLIKTYGGTFITVEVDSDAAAIEQILQTINQNEVHGTIVYGGVSAISNQPFGSLTLSIKGDPASVSQSVNDIRKITHVDVLNHQEGGVL